MAKRSEPDFRGLRAVALLELLARAAPARVVAPELLLLGDHALLRDRRDRAAAVAADVAGHRGRGSRFAAEPRRGDRVGAGERLVLVRERARGAVAGSELEIRGVAGVELRVEEQADDLLVDREAELLEHRVALAAVLDQRVLLRHGAEVHAL